eukprot:GHVT01101649.1.p1 GENE.GHVT01101649.1~~GHVT01101649.1.p1  ORF type:complete len:515 (+),score=22.58 GHVT01101649.1:1608-3152(+)
MRTTATWALATFLALVAIVTVVRVFWFFYDGPRLLLAMREMAIEGVKEGLAEFGLAPCHIHRHRTMVVRNDTRSESTSDGAEPTISHMDHLHRRLPQPPPSEAQERGLCSPVPKRRRKFTPSNGATTRTQHFADEDAELDDRLSLASDLSQTSTPRSNYRKQSPPSTPDSGGRALPSRPLSLRTYRTRPATTEAGGNSAGPAALAYRFGAEENRLPIQEISRASRIGWGQLLVGGYDLRLLLTSWGIRATQKEVSSMVHPGGSSSVDLEDGWRSNVMGNKGAYPKAGSEHRFQTCAEPHHTTTRSKDECRQEAHSHQHTTNSHNEITPRVDLQNHLNHTPSEAGPPTSDTNGDRWERVVRSLLKMCVCLGSVRLSKIIEFLRSDVGLASRLVLWYHCPHPLSGAAALICFAGGMLCWFSSWQDNYWLVHSLWHVFIFLTPFWTYRAMQLPRAVERPWNVPEIQKLKLCVCGLRRNKLPNSIHPAVSSSPKSTDDYVLNNTPSCPDSVGSGSPKI